MSQVSIYKDKRYEIGNGELRYCGEVIATSRSYSTLVMRAVGHRATNDGGQEPIVEVRG